MFLNYKFDFKLGSSLAERVFAQFPFQKVRCSAKQLKITLVRNLEIRLLMLFSFLNNRGAQQKLSAFLNKKTVFFLQNYVMLSDNAISGILQSKLWDRAGREFLR